MQVNSIKNTANLINASINIGDHLVKTAIWDNSKKHCNWLGRRDIQDAQLAAYSKRNSALSPEFYSGSAGVSHFLLELYKVTENNTYKETALGAWLRSVHYMKSYDFPASSISFYAGELGLIYIGYRFIEVAPEIENHIQESLNWLIGKLANGLNTKHSLDVIGGNAGAIPVLISLYKKYTLEIFKEMAIKCADEIVSLGSWNDDICVWASPKVHGVELNTPPTTGYSHGASGIGVALLEAYAFTKNEQYLKYGRGAFTFEQALFNDDEGNWIDTRYPHFKKNGKVTGTFRSAWCHGAPGISLAHLRASFLDKERATYHLNLAAIGIETTKKHLLDKFHNTPEKDATLCHGILGLSDIVFSYGKKMEEKDSIQFSKKISQLYLNEFNDITLMPSGLTLGGYNPSIMVGLSGIGLHYLRLSSNTIIPTPLILIL